MYRQSDAATSAREAAAARVYREFIIGRLSSEVSLEPSTRRRSSSLSRIENPREEGASHGDSAMSEDRIGRNLIEMKSQSPPSKVLTKPLTIITMASIESLRAVQGRNAIPNNPIRISSRKAVAKFFYRRSSESTRDQVHLSSIPDANSSDRYRSTVRGEGGPRDSAKVVTLERVIALLPEAASPDKISERDRRSSD